ncbi:MAG: hypothetical protein ABIG20_03935 [archaeon]
MNIANKNYVLGILVLIVLISSMVVSSGSVTGFISYPFPCTSSFDFDAPSAINIYPGGSGEAVVVISNVMCGITHVQLELQDLPEEYFTIKPELIASIAPRSENYFTITFNVPEGAEVKTYLGTYYLKSSEGFYTQGTVDVVVKNLPEKPAIEVMARETMPMRGNANGWWAVGFIATLLAIMIVGSEFFKDAYNEPKRIYKSSSKKELGDVLNKAKR